MNAVMTRLGQDHARLARVLDLLDQLLDRFHEGHEPDYDLLCEMLEYMGSYADQIHHPTEDLIFRRALDKGVSNRDVFDVLMHQHGLVPQLNRRFHESLDAIIHEDVLLRDEVEAQGRELVDTLRTHMTMEDEEAFPIALERLDEADWDAVAAIAPTADDPLFVTPDPERFSALYAQLSRHAQAQD